VYTIHKLTGLAVLIITLYFICWRSLNEKPAYGITVPRWEQIAAKSVQHSMLLLAIVMSLSGWFFSTAKNKSPAFLGYQIPMPGVIVSTSWAKVGTTIHYYAAWLLFGLVCIHTFAALKHYFYDKDNILQRMFWE
jgi:cytochrome b561